MKNSRPFDYWLLWLVALVSLGLNLWLINLLVGVRRQAGQGAATAAQALSALSQSSIDYLVHIEQALPISVTIPISHTLSAPISATLPISTQVLIPLDTPLGQFPINLPIQARVPINLRPQIPISLSVPISLTVPVVLDVPIHVALSETQLGQSLGDAKEYLETLAEQWGAATPQPTSTP
jgi:hypothetical protein